jgi:transcriptional regulator GlxA family with amidase domain
MSAGRLTVGFLLADRFTLSAFSTFVDALRLAADEGDGSRQNRCRWHVMSASGRPVVSSSGVEVMPTSELIDPERLDYIAIVGGLLPRSGGASRPVDVATEAYLARAAAGGATLIGVCTGSFILARLGLLDGTDVCVSWYHYRDFVEMFPDLPASADRLFITANRRITCSGGTGAADLAAFLVDCHLGQDLARKSMRILLQDRARPGIGPQPQPPSTAEAEDPRVKRALLLMEQRVSEPLSIEAIADELAIGVRQLERLFRDALGIGPNAAYARLRLQHADWLLRMTERSITEVALECGFADCAHFSRNYKASFGQPPSAARPRRRLRQPVEDMVLGSG